MENQETEDHDQSIENQENEDHDQISGLPDDVLLQILSYLPREEIVRNSILGRRWRTVVSPVDLVSLEFYHGGDDGGDEAKEVFLNRIQERVSATHTMCSLEINIPYNDGLKVPLDAVIGEALSKKLRVLILILSRENDLYLFDLFDDETSIYGLPRVLCENSELLHLNTSCISWGGISAVNWSKMNMLEMTQCLINDDIMNLINVGCPSLKTFKIIECWGYSIMDFPQLQKLIIIGKPLYDIVERELRLLGPEIQSMEISGKLDGLLIFPHLLECRDLKLNYYWTDAHHYKDVLTRWVSPVLDGAAHVENITLGTWLIEVLSSIDVSDELNLELPGCVSLTIHSPLLLRYQRGVLLLIEACTNLVSLTLYNHRSYPICKSCPPGDCFFKFDFMSDRFKKLKCTEENGKFHIKKLILKNANSVVREEEHRFVEFIKSKAVSLEEEIYE